MPESKSPSRPEVQNLPEYGRACTRTAIRRRAHSRTKLLRQVDGPDERFCDVLTMARPGQHGGETWTCMEQRGSTDAADPAFGDTLCRFSGRYRVIQSCSGDGLSMQRRQLATAWRISPPSTVRHAVSGLIGPIHLHIREALP